MSIVFDAKLPPNTAQTHVLIAGVGDYPHLLGGSKFNQQPAANSFGLRQLTSPQVSAAAFANWLPTLVNKKAPLGTVDLLLSPIKYVDGSGNHLIVDPPTMAGLKTAFREWSRRSDANSANVAIFYYCGHGMEKEATTILLPSDFGNPAEANISANMIDFDLTYSCNLLESSARTQLYLIDACRETPTQLLALRTSPTSLISTMKLQQQPRDALVIKATNTGWQAHGDPGTISFFTQALLTCLQKVGARGRNGARWEVATSSLGQAMKYFLQRMKRPGLPSLLCDVAGRSNFDTAIHTLPGAAYVMSSIDCDPEVALAEAQFAIRDGTVPIDSRNTPLPEPYEVDIPAGEYDIEVKFAADKFVSKVCRQLMQPPFTPCTLEVDR
jgi:Caspase domain